MILAIIYRVYLRMKASARGIILVDGGLRRYREGIYTGEGVLKLFLGFFEQSGACVRIESCAGKGERVTGRKPTGLGRF